jgi:hypothetical protein
MYLLPYVILKIILLTNTVAEPVLEILLPVENGQSLTNADQSNSANDDEKTLAQQIFEGKYGLIHKELFNDIPSRPGILSYNINPEVPKDNINNLGGLDSNEIWLAENHLLVLKGGNFSDKKVKWTYIDNYIAPIRQVKIPENPKIPPPFPIQLEDNGPIDFVTVNGSIWNPIFSPQFPPIQGLPLNTTLDEDDQSLFYPPKYDFVYAQENSTRVPPGPLVPGIVLPPPPNFFGPLEKPEKAKKINLNTNKTIPRFNQKPYFKIPKGNHNSKENGWVPIPSIKPNYIEDLKIKNNVIITTTENNNYNSNFNEQNSFPNHQFLFEKTVKHTTIRPETYYYYDENSKYDVEKPVQQNKYVNSGNLGIRNQQYNIQNNFEKSTTGKPYYEYSYVAPGYAIKSQIQTPINKQKPMTEHQKENPVYQEWSEKPKSSQYSNQLEKQKHQSWSQQNNQYTEIDYGYHTEKPNFATDNPYHAFFTQDDASLVDENTKKYFALFGQKVRTEKPIQVTPQSKHQSSKHDNKISLIDNILINFKQPLPINNPESEITTSKSRYNYPQLSLHDDTNVNFKQPNPQINSDAEMITQNTNILKENHPYSYDNTAINYQHIPLKNVNIDETIKKPYTQDSFKDNNPMNYKQPLQLKIPNTESITKRPNLNIPQLSFFDDTKVNYKQPLPPINLNSEIITKRPLYRPIHSLFDNTNINYKQPMESENLNAERITQRPHIHVTQSDFNLDTSLGTNDPNLEHATQKSYMQIPEAPYYSVTTITNKQPYSSINQNAELVTQRPYIHVPETSLVDGISINYKLQGYSNSETVTQRPYIKVPQTSYLENTQVNYQQPILQQNPSNEAAGKRPQIKFPQTSLTDNNQFNFKRPLPLQNHDTEYFTQRPQTIYSHTPVYSNDDIQINYKQPLQTKNIETEYKISTQRPLNRVVSYNLPGNSGSHFFFLTTHTGHPIQYNLSNNNYQYYKRNVK